MEKKIFYNPSIFKLIPALLKKKKYSLSPLLGIVFAMILDGTADELELLKDSYRKIDMCRQKEEIYKPAEIRFGFSDEITNNQFMKTKLLYREHGHQIIISAICAIRQIFQRAFKGFVAGNNFEQFTKDVKSLSMLKNDEVEIMREHEEFKQTYEDMLKQISFEKQTLLDDLQKAEVDTRKVMGELEVYLNEAAVKSITILRWQKSRRELNMHVNKNAEKKIQNDYDENRKNAEEEEMVHNEMRKFFEQDIEDIKEDIEKWMVKYDQDLDDTDIRIAKKRIDIDQMNADIEELEDLIRKRRDEMLNWKRYKFIDKLKYKIAEKKHWAAGKIQKWWKSILEERRLERLKRRRKKKRSDSKNKNKNKTKKKKR